METISPDTSPTLISNSPPLTPMDFTLNKHMLPPLNSLPTWSRTKFTVNNRKIIRSIPKDQNVKVEFINNDVMMNRETQTSPPKPTSKDSLSSSSESLPRRGKQKLYEKKIVFLQTTHEEVLTRLHRELETLKNENKALQFRLILADEKGLTCKNDAEHGCEKEKTILLLHDEIGQLKEQLTEERQKNLQLLNSIEKQKERSLSAYSKKESKQISAGTLKTPRVFQSAKRLPLGENNNGTIEFKERLKELRALTTTQQNELVNLREKLKANFISDDGKNVILPKISSKPPRSGKCKPPISMSYKQPDTSLPILQPFVGNRNLTMRQKRARDLHVQRQKSNKDIRLTLLGTK